MLSKSLLIFAIAAYPLAARGAAPATDSAIDVDHVMRVAAKKLAAFDSAHTDTSKFPTEAKGDKWVLIPPYEWTSGFYPGALWYMYEYARATNPPEAEAWRARAQRWTAGLKQEQFNRGTHDLGFMMFDSFGNGYRITKNAEYQKVLLQSAKSLAARYRPVTRMIRSQGNMEDMDRYTVIIDNMMNLELLMWASENGGGTELRQIAISHADRALKEFFRPDGSTYHVVELNPNTGDVQRKYTAQGMADESCWSRGQTWAIYGFGYMYEVTKDQRYLDAAVKAAEYYLAHLPADNVPPSDFNSGLDGLEFKDSSAACVASSALFRLSRLVPDAARKDKYSQAAVAALRAVTEPPYFSEGDDKAGMILYSARNFHASPNHRLTNTSLIWSDYYLLEAIHQYLALNQSLQAQKISNN